MSSKRWPAPWACLTLAAAVALSPSGAARAVTAASTPSPSSATSAAVASPLAANRLDQILARGELRVGTTGDYKPFTDRVGSGDTFIGLDIALAADLARTLGVRLRLVPTTWATLMPDLGDDRFDIAMGGVSVSLDRQKTAFFSIPYLRDGKTPITRCENVGKYQTLADIDRPEVRLIVNPGGTNERFVRAQAPHATLVPHPDNVTIFDRLLAGDADVMITDAIETRLQQHLHPALCAVHPDAPFDFSEKAVLLPRDAVLKAYVDQWLHQSIESGAFARANAHWLAYPWGLAALRQAIDARLMLASDVARDKWNHHTPIEDRPREEEVIAALALKANALGVPLASAERFFRAQIEASKIAQAALFRRWADAGQGAFPDAPDLAGVTRPKLDRLTDALLRALAENQPTLSGAHRREEIAGALHPMDAQGVSPEAVETAIAPLLTESDGCCPRSPSSP